MKTALTIAGSDSCGGAGIQADIKTMTANGVYAMSAITALTAQNTTGVTDILESTPHFLAEQLDAVFTDITPDAVKIGMVSSAELIETTAAKLKQYGAKHIVVDPVMVATSGSKLLRDDAVSALCANLLPMAEVLTPNIPEAEILADMPIKNAADMEKAAQTISEKYGFASLREQGIHLVLRFVCDVPGQETHLDIPDWLYAQTKDGSWYDTDYGKGYSPNYANVVFRAAHHRVLYALAEFLLDY